MVVEQKPLLLVVEDDLDVAEMLRTFFTRQGYDVQAVHWGEEVAEFCRKRLPGLVILDIRLPDIDGYEVARRLRTSRRTKDVPILFLTEKRSRGDRLQGLELGADDYITKPFDVQELGLRVRNALQRAASSALHNPITGLPQGELVDECLRQCLTQPQWAILRVILENMEAFREAYGFVAADDVLRAISLMIQNAVRDLGKAGDFVGQVAENDFILITQPEALAALRERIQARLEQTLDYFYPLEDAQKASLPSRRLAVHFSLITASQGPFKDIQHLKSQIFQAGGNVTGRAGNHRRE